MKGEMRRRLAIGVCVWIALMLVIRLFTRGHEAELKKSNDIANENIARYVVK
jgi:hypothetical protein